NSALISFLQRDAQKLSSYQCFAQHPHSPAGKLSFNQLFAAGPARTQILLMSCRATGLLPQELSFNQLFAIFGAESCSRSLLPGFPSKSVSQDAVELLPLLESIRHLYTSMAWLDRTSSSRSPGNEIAGGPERPVKLTT